MTRVKPISGIFWACDVLDGRREFPTFNKKEPDTAADTAQTGAEFQRVFNKACADLDARNARQGAAGRKP